MRSVLLMSVVPLVVLLGSADAAGDKIVCYYASWNHYKKGVAQYRTDDIPVYKCTHLIYAFWVLDPTTYMMKSHDQWLDVDLDNLNKVTNLKLKNPNLKVLLAVGGWTDSRAGDKYSKLVKDRRKMEKFSRHAVQVLQKYNFDGLDLDWEYPAYQSDVLDKEGFTDWLEILKSEFSPHGLLLSAAVSAGKYNIDRGYDIPAVGRLLDFINIMTYDFHGGWENIARHHSPLFPQDGVDATLNTKYAVDYWVEKGAPREKIIVGVPFYGRSWTLEDGSGTALPGAVATGKGRSMRYTRSAGTMAYYECCLAHKQEGWYKNPASPTMGPYLTKGDQWVGYDDIETVTKKAEYVKSRQLGGVMVWDLTTDDFNNLCGDGAHPLLTAIHNTLKSTSKTHHRGSGINQLHKNENNIKNQNVKNRFRNFKQFQETEQPNFNHFTTTESSLALSTVYPWQAWPIFNNNNNIHSTKTINSDSIRQKKTNFSPNTPIILHNSIQRSHTNKFQSPQHRFSNNISPDSKNQRKNNHDEIFTNSHMIPVNNLQNTNQNSQISNNDNHLLQNGHKKGEKKIVNQFDPNGNNQNPHRFSFNSNFVSKNTLDLINLLNSINRLGNSQGNINQKTNNQQNVNFPSTVPNFNSQPTFSNDNENSFTRQPFIQRSTSQFSRPSQFTQIFNSNPDSSQTTQFINPLQSTERTIFENFNTNPHSPTFQTTQFTQQPPSTQGIFDQKTTTLPQSPFGPTTLFSKHGSTLHQNNINNALTPNFHDTTISQPLQSTQRTNSNQNAISTFQNTQFPPTTQNTITPIILSKKSKTQSPKISSKKKLSSRTDAAAAGKSFGFSWMRKCRNSGFSSDPESCNHFYRCTTMYAYRFRCPSGLMYSTKETSCVWPQDATC